MPEHKKRYVMVVDIKRCVGCHTCAIACKQGNNLPNDIWWNRVLTCGGENIDTPEGEYPSSLDISYLTFACQHCDEPACVKSCPTKATWQREDDIVMQDYDKCMGCEMCVMACPYDAVRTLNEKEPEYHLDFAVGDATVEPQQKGTVSKCNFCYERVDQGLLPNCIEVCPVNARHFGDINDKDSDVYTILQEREHIRLLEEKGTKPSVYFLK
jgi:molybdopterin-containing oxidoreductase family iron-sulfur binding subunit